MYQLLCLIVVSFALIKTGGYQIDVGLSSDYYKN